MFKSLKQFIGRSKLQSTAERAAAESLAVQVPTISPAEAGHSELPVETACNSASNPDIIRFSRPQRVAADEGAAEPRRADSFELSEADALPSIPITKGAPHTWLAMSGLPDAERAEAGTEPPVLFEETRLALELNPRVMAVCRKVADRLWDRACAASPNVVLLSPVSSREESFPWAAYVGAALAEPGSEVLCIETMTALPAASVCDLPQQAPLAELMLGTAGAEVERAGWATTYEHLSLLPRQQLEECTSHEAAEIWRWLGERYRWVIVNAGHGERPLAQRLARSSNLAVLCLTLGRTRRRRALDAIETLERAGARVVGCIAVARG